MSMDQHTHDEPVAIATFSSRGEAEVAEAKLRAYGIEGFIDDQVEGGALPVEGEPGVMVLVHPTDAADARRILAGDEPAASDPTDA